MKTALIVVFGLVALASLFFGRYRAALMPESLFVVEFNDATIVVTAPNAEKHSVAWKDLTKVGIRTTDDGPMQPDVFWGLHSNSETPAVVFPGGATGENELIKAMQSRLANFNSEEFIKAMGSTSNAYFLIWTARPVAEK